MGIRLSSTIWELLTLPPSWLPGMDSLSLTLRPVPKTFRQKHDNYFLSYARISAVDNKIKLTLGGRLGGIETIPDMIYDLTQQMEHLIFTSTVIHVCPSAYSSYYNNTISVISMLTVPYCI